MGRPDTALERLEEFVKKTPDGYAVVYEPGARLTFKELWQLSGKIYAWLKAKGIGPEDVVMYCLPRGLMLYACMAGTMRAGAAFVLTETQNDPERTAFIRKDSDCRLFVDESCLPEILSFRPLEGYEPVRLHSLCYISYTSGTTGHPKGVMHEYGSLDNAWRAVMVDGSPIMHEGDIFLSMSPMNFVAMPIIFAYLCGHGCATALMPYEYSKSRESFYDYIDRAGVNCGYITPTFLRKMQPFHAPWHMCILSAEPADGLFVNGMKCYNTYASTEGGCLLTVYELSEAVTPAPVGKSYSGVEVLIVDEDETEVLPGEIGEVCFRTPYVRGYIHQLRRQGEGLFHTGDAGKINAEGNMLILGRLDEMFKIRGCRIEPDEVANAVRKVSGISGVVVRGFVFRDISSIVAFYSDHHTVDPVSLHEALLGELPEYMIPTNYIRLKDFSVLGSGKVDKLSLLPPEGNWDRFKKSAAAELPVIGKGRTSSVYDMGDGIVLKQFAASIPYGTVWDELTRTHIAHICGLPVPEVYDITRSDEGYGILMEKLSGTNLEEMIRERPEERFLLIDLFAGAVKALHQVDCSGTDLEDAKENSIRICEQFDKNFCTDEERKQIRKIFECIPDAGTFTHGDCHLGNAILYDGGIRFFDLTFAEKGHAVFDLIGMYAHYVFLPSFISEGEYKARSGLTKKEAMDLYDRFLDIYYPEKNAAEISMIKECIRGVHAARICLASVTMPGIFSDEMLEEVKRRAVCFSGKHCGKGSVPCQLPI